MSDDFDYFSDDPDMPDAVRDECNERVALDYELDAEREAWEKLAHTDPIGATMFADNDAWIEKRLRG